MSTSRQDSNPDRRSELTRIGYRRPEDMTDQARELTAKRGNLNVYRTLANADKVFTGWMLAGDAALTSPVVPSGCANLSSCAPPT